MGLTSSCGVDFSCISLITNEYHRSFDKSFKRARTKSLFLYLPTPMFHDEICVLLFTGLRTKNHVAKKALKILLK